MTPDTIIDRIKGGEAVTIPAWSLRRHELPPIILAAVEMNVSPDTIRTMLGELKRAYDVPHAAGVLARTLGQRAMRSILAYANTGL